MFYIDSIFTFYYYRFNLDQDATISYLQIRVYLIPPVLYTDEQTPYHNPLPCNDPPLRVANVGLAFHAWTGACDICHPFPIRSCG